MVNKIAAGEIIVAPVHALKELMENAVDAGSTSLEILVKEGGLKLLQITDNGSGISVSLSLEPSHLVEENKKGCGYTENTNDPSQKEDLPILCERFTTSKLQKFEDLTSIATYGFRGEALASISHIAHLTVATKTRDSNCAWRAHYDGGKLVPAKPGQTSDPKPVAGRPGTQITVEDLFYNVPSRRQAFRSPSDEYNKIIDMVGRYAIHCSHVAFSCKKHGESSTSVAIQTNATTVDRVRQLYGGSVANELIEYSTADPRWSFKAQGWATNANYSIKKTTLLLFINHRCVESSNIRKAIEQTYTAFLPKNGHPFVYLSLEIDPQRVDVNIHPTKREVNFLNEDEIIQAVCEHIRSKLAAVDTSRTFMTQTLLPGGPWTTSAPQRQQDVDATPASKSGAGLKKTPARPNENNLVRTDTNLRKITSMLPPAGGPSVGTPSRTATTSGGVAGADLGPQVEQGEQIEYETVYREPVACRLGSVRELRASVRDDMHLDLTEIFANHTFVGILDRRRRIAGIQSGVRLFIVDYGRTCFEYLYQLGLTDFGNFGAIEINPPLNIKELLKEVAGHNHSLRAASVAHGRDLKPGGDDKEWDPTEFVDFIAEKLIERREMLLEYFSLEISPAGELLSIPLLVKGYTPPLVKLPQFLLNLGPRVGWTEEKACLDAIVKELAAFYTPEQLPSSDDDVDDDAEGGGDGDVDEVMEARAKHVLWAVEHIFFPAFKARLVATNLLMKNGVLEAASLKGLYRVFERC